jgi:hypothetical protein
MRRLPVLNRGQQLVGMVALGDLAMHAGTRLVAAAVLAQVSEPGTSQRKERPTPGRHAGERGRPGLEARTRTDWRHAP